MGELGMFKAGSKKYFVKVEPLPKFLQHGRLKGKKWVVTEHIPAVNEIERQKKTGRGAVRWFLKDKPKLNKGIGGLGIAFNVKDL